MIPSEVSFNDHGRHAVDGDFGGPLEVGARDLDNGTGLPRLGGDPVVVGEPTRGAM